MIVWIYEMGQVYEGVYEMEIFSTEEKALAYKQEQLDKYGANASCYFFEVYEKEVL